MNNIIRNLLVHIFTGFTLVCLFSPPLQAQKVDRWLTRMDADEDGQISAKEWSGGTPFTRIDLDGNGQATRKELSVFQKWRKKKRRGKKARLHRRFPNAQFRNPAGRTVYLKDLKGRVVVLLPFSTWCPPCVRKLSDYVRIYDQYKNSEKVAVILYNYKDPYELVVNHVRYNGGGDVPVMNAGKTGDEGAPGWLHSRSGKTIKMPGSMPQAWLIDQSGVVAQELTSRAGQSGIGHRQRFCADIERLSRNLPVQSDWSKPPGYDWKKWSSC